MRYRHGDWQWSRRWRRLRTEPDRELEVMNAYLENRLFDSTTARFIGEDIHATWRHLRNWFSERGIAVHTADHLLAGRFVSARNIFVSLGMREHCRTVAVRPDVTLSAFFAFECP